MIVLITVACHPFGRNFVRSLAVVVIIICDVGWKVCGPVSCASSHITPRARIMEHYQLSILQEIVHSPHTTHPQEQQNRAVSILHFLFLLSSSIMPNTTSSAKPTKTPKTTFDMIVLLDSLFASSGCLRVKLQLCAKNVVS